VKTRYANGKEWQLRTCRQQMLSWRCSSSVPLRLLLPHFLVYSCVAVSVAGNKTIRDGVASQYDSSAH
jgi:hypothetical protein